MPTKDSGKPTSRRRPAEAGSGAGKGPETVAQPAHAGKRTPSGPQKPTPRAARHRAPRATGASPTTSGASGTPAVPLEPVAAEPREAAPEAFAALGVPGPAVEPVEEPAVPEPEPAEGPGVPEGGALPDAESPRRRDRRGAGTNALGVFIERQFANPTSPAHSYSDLERHSGISREALSRYVTARTDRRRSPTIDTLVAIADALHVSLEAVARAAGASVKGVIPPPEDVQHAREETLGALVAALSDEQFSAVVELLRQMRPPLGE